MELDKDLNDTIIKSLEEKTNEKNRKTQKKQKVEDEIISNDPTIDINSESIETSEIGSHISQIENEILIKNNVVKKEETENKDHIKQENDVDGVPIDDMLVNEYTVKDNIDNIIVSSKDIIRDNIDANNDIKKEEEYTIKELFPDGFKVLSPEEIDKLREEGAYHFKLLQAEPLINPEILKNASINKNIEIIDVESNPTLDMEYIAIEAERNNHGNATEVVCVQSGYKVWVRGMKYRELSEFGRLHVQGSTYSYYVNLYRTLYNQLRNFSCSKTGMISFESFMEITSWYDTATLMFGLYMSCFPGVNDYTFACDFCGKDVKIKLDNKSIMFIPPGDTITIETIKNILYKDKPIDIAEMRKAAKINKIKRIFLNNRTIFFDIKIPSLAEYLKKAYYNKSEDVITKHHKDMFYAGHIYGAGVVDTKTFRETGKIRYLHVKQIDKIEMLIASLSAEDRVEFDKAIMKFVYENTISYRLPSTQCPHCKNVMTQREINVESLFFDVRESKGIS